MQDPNGRNKISACGAWAKLFEKNDEKEHYKEGQYIHASYPVSYTHLDVYKRQV